MSLKLMTWEILASSLAGNQTSPHVLMTKVLEKLQLSVCSFREHRGAERFHDLLDCHSLAGQLVFGRTARSL